MCLPSQECTQLTLRHLVPIDLMRIGANPNFNQVGDRIVASFDKMQTWGTMMARQADDGDLCKGDEAAE
jgi:hypothetical protein